MIEDMKNLAFLNRKSRVIVSVISVLTLLLFHSNISFACTGGTNAGNINVNASWQTISCNTYTYYNFTASYAGESFIFSFCQGGGSSSVDTQLEVHDNMGVSTGSYNDDACGTGSELIFTAPSSGTYRISIYRYNCLTTSVSAGALAYKLIVPNNQDCVGAISVCQPTYYQDQSFFGYGAILDYTSTNTCPGLCVDDEDLSVWYTFQVQTSGVLDFRITPNQGSSDYDWVLFNLTNHDCSIIPNINSYPSLVTSCNAAYDYGTTGANTLTPNTGTNCQGPSTLGEYPINNPTINVTAGQIYYLNIQNWSATQGGYTLDFSNSSATIFDNNPPFVDEFTEPSCNSGTFIIIFNENIDCSTIDISDFSITGPGGPYSITNIVGDACAIGGTMEREFLISFSPSITTAGTYTVNYDGSALDMCGNVCSADSWNFTITSAASMTLSSAASTLNQAVCSGNPITTITWTSTGGTNATFTGLPAGVNGTFNSGTGAINISGTATENGTFNFTVSLAGSCGSATASGTITISDNITPVFSSYGPYCIGETPASLPTNSNNGVSGTWSPSAINTNTAGTFNFTFTPTAGQCSGPITLTVTVNNGAIPVFDSFGPYCYGEVPDILPNISNNGVSGTWNPATINTSITGITNYTFTPSSGVCNSPTQINISVTSLPIVHASLTTPVNCNGTSGIVTVTASGGTSPYSGTGSFTVTTGNYNFVVIDHNGCTGSDQITISAPSQLEGEIYKVNDVECNGEATGSLAIEISQGNPAFNIRWFGYNQNSSSNFIVADRLRAGTYDVTITDSRGCTLTQSVYISEPSSLHVNYMANGPSCIGNNDGFIELFVSGGTAPYTYLWETVGIDTTVLDGLFGGRYHLLIQDANECVLDLGELILRDNPIDCLRIPNTITPNGDGINDIWEIENIEVFPKAEARIFNRWGQMIYYDSPIDNPWDGYYNGKRLPAGTYVYVLQTYTDIKDYTGTITIVH
jgi:gliding motility-associated-like protein